ncbi:MAG: hypothetical protein D3904_15215, partial [Candidatus Electrothrix sp. EH2]|nr:hypothetical protein [Candidatus Electrothrix sp. EH2]
MKIRLKYFFLLTTLFVLAACSASDFIELVVRQKITATDGAGLDMFGCSVSLSANGQIALIGAPGNDNNGTNSGAAYVFTHSDSTWTQETKLTPAASTADKAFGCSVSLSVDGSTALIGDCYDDDGGKKAGSAYIFTRSNSTWTQEAKLTAADSTANAEFGKSVSISADGSTALIGAISSNDNITDFGSAYVFVNSDSTWTQQAKLTASDGTVGNKFGFSLSLSADGDTALIGA